LPAPIPFSGRAAQPLLDSRWHQRTAKRATLDSKIERHLTELLGVKTDVERSKRRRAVDEIDKITPTDFLEIAGRFRPAAMECTRI
jgi:hypothetical protein